jgi:hypothetical protein
MPRTHPTDESERSSRSDPRELAVYMRGALLVIVGATLGCTMMKSGSGAAMYGMDPVKFSWTSSSNLSGSMTATLADGEIFRGRFSQAISQKTFGDLGSQGPRWHQQGEYDIGPALESVPHYTGQVAAELAGPDGAVMSCRFELNRPADGMASGARGKCQLPDDVSVAVEFPTT